LASELPATTELLTPPSAPATVDFSPTIPFSQAVTVETPILLNIPTTTTSVNPLPKPVSDLSPFTIFTVTGRLGAEKKESESGNKKSEKRERGVSLFGSLLPLPFVDDETPSEPIPQREPPKRQSVEPSNVEQPKQSKEGISLDELFDSKFIPTNEPYKGELSEQIQQSIDTTDRLRFIRRVAAACQSAAQRNGPVRIKLRPESLGPLTIRVATKKGKLSIHFETETADAKRLLLDNLDDLKARLRRMNVELEDCRVD
jgi:hypothetical protein